MFYGIVPEENMNNCIFNNYCFEDFWRAWHKSFNQWLIKYIYIPLGGSRFKILSIWVVFTFVALWHDLKLELLLWAWFICICLVPEVSIKKIYSKFKRRKYELLNETKQSKEYEIVAENKLKSNKLLLVVLKSFESFFAATYIILMIFANLIGFGISQIGFGSTIINMALNLTLKEYAAIYLLLIPHSFVLFLIKDFYKSNHDTLKNKFNKYEQGSLTN